MNRVGLYFHSGSGNHGCEAIVRTTNKIIQSNYKTVLFSFARQEDIKFGLESITSIVQFRDVVKHEKVKGFKYYFKLIFPNYSVYLLKYLKNKLIKKNIDTRGLEKDCTQLIQDNINLYFSIGGDNYCYGYYGLIYINEYLNKHNKKTILLGCSIEPKYIEQDASLRKDLDKYSLIIARKSLTYDALINAGINKNTYLIPDLAFVLDTIIPSDLPKKYIEYNTVGINISPLVCGFEKNRNITYKNICCIIEYILKNTNMNIALIPHVIWGNDNDLEPLTKLYDKFKNTKRVCLIDDRYNCMELKGIISKCRFLVAARTHASIAGYSSQVPTLVVGYSIKSKGIAKDIFGSYADYIISVQDLKKEDDILNVFKILISREEEIRQYYKIFMPSYIEKVWQIKDLIEKLKD
jgi:polysaccharide pyruvyl transferase WcaK-like protein